MSNEGHGRRLSRAFSGDSRNMSQLSQQERRVIRLKYRALMDQVPSPVSEVTDEQDQDLDSLTSTLVEADAIFEKLPQMPREAALDSKLVNQLSILGASIAQRLDTNLVTFHSTEFTELLDNFISPSEKTITDWKEVGKNVTSFFRRAPPLTFMYGSFKSDQLEMPEKQKEKRTALQLKATGKKQAPEKISAMGTSDKEVTTAEVDKILLSLNYLCNKYKGPLCFFEFVVHPTSFTQTVLNIFHVAFLIRDEYAIVYLDNDGLPVIEAVTDKTGGSNSHAPKPRKNEVVLTMNKSQWRAIVKEFKIEQASIPSSRPLAEMAGPSSATSSSSQMRH